MKVKEAVEFLLSADPDAELFISSDEEGNSYRPAHLSANETMCDQGEWVACHPEDIENGEYSGWEDDMIPAVVFW